MIKKGAERARHVGHVVLLIDKRSPAKLRTAQEGRHPAPPAFSLEHTYRGSTALPSSSDTNVHYLAILRLNDDELQNQRTQWHSWSDSRHHFHEKTSRKSPPGEAALRTPGLAKTPLCTGPSVGVGGSSVSSFSFPLAELSPASEGDVSIRGARPKSPTRTCKDVTSEVVTSATAACFEHASSHLVDL